MPGLMVELGGKYLSIVLIPVSSGLSTISCTKIACSLLFIVLIFLGIHVQLLKELRSSGFIFTGDIVQL